MSGPDGGCEGVQGPGGGYEGVGEPGNGRAGVIGPGGRGEGAEDLGGECVGVGGPCGRCAGVGGQVADMGKECEPKSPSKKVDPPLHPRSPCKTPNSHHRRRKCHLCDFLEPISIGTFALCMPSICPPWRL